MNHSYLCIKSIYSNEETYGIAAACFQDGKAVLLKIFTDLSPDRNAVEQLAKICNEHQLDMIHLKDVVDDFLLSL